MQQPFDLPVSLSLNNLTLVTYPKALYNLLNILITAKVYHNISSVM